MKRRILTMLLTLVVALTMTMGSVTVSWAGIDMSAIESSIKNALKSYEAQELTSDGDLHELVWKSLPSDMQSATIDIYRDKFTPATEDTDGSITFYVAIDDDLVTEEGNPFAARIPKLGKPVDTTPSAELEEDWSLVGKAVAKVKISNSTTKEQLLSVAKAAVKNGSTCELSENKFYKVEATTDKDGSITIYIAVSLDGKSKELRYSKKIPMLGTNMPSKSISVNKEEWRILRETNKERFKEGKKLLTMVGALQKACDTRTNECVKYDLKAHRRPDGSLFNTAIPSSYGTGAAGENLYNCTRGVSVTGESAMFAWMNSTLHRKNLLDSKWNYIGIGVQKNVGVQIFSKKSSKIVKYTTSAGKTTFSSVAEMEDAYLICTDSAGRKSYMPLDKDYMKKVSGGYTLNLNSSKTIKIKVKSSTSSGTYSDVASKDKAAVKWVVKKKIMKPLNSKEFRPTVACTKGEVFEYIYKANGAPRTGFKGIKNWFVDLKSTDSYYYAVFWAKKKGYIDYGQFSGEQVFTRGQALYYVWLSVGSPKAKKATTFNDFRKEVYYAKAVAWAQEKKIYTDTGDHKFGGDDHLITRGEMARLIYYAYK